MEVANNPVTADTGQGLCLRSRCRESAVFLGAAGVLHSIPIGGKPQSESGVIFIGVSHTVGLIRLGQPTLKI